MNGKLCLAAIGAAGLLLLLMCMSWSHNRPRPSGNDTQTRGSAGTTSPSAPGQRPVSRPDPDKADVYHLLPFPPEAITQAAELARNFTAAYGTHRYNEPPQEYLRRLAPMISPQLRPSIERAATDPATLTQRQRTQEVSTGQARPETIRALGPSSITFLLTETEHVTTAHAARQDTTRYAVTLIHSSQGWLVYSIELAAIGDTGDRGTDS